MWLSNKEQYSEIKPDENNLIDLGNYFDLSKPNQVLEDFSEKNFIYFIDLLPYFEKHKNEDLFLLPEDPHFNKKGNELAAEVIYESLELSNLINMK